MPQTTSQPFVLSGVHDKILQEAIVPYHLVTASQITRRLYKYGMFTTVKVRLKDLAEAGYLYRFHLPSVKPQKPFVYCLSDKGKKYLEQQGIDVPVYYLPKESEYKSYGFLLHILELNGFLINAAILPKSVPFIQLLTMRHDLVLKKSPCEVVRDNGKTGMLVPDALLSFRVWLDRERARHYFVWVELDRGTQSSERFRQKLHDIVTFVAQGGHIKQFGAEARAIRIAYATTAGKTRLAALRKLARDELGQVAEGSPQNQMLMFSCVPAFGETVEPRQVFCSAWWQHAYGDAALPLLDIRDIQQNW